MQCEDLAESSSMKRPSSSDSLGALASTCPNSTDEHNQGKNPTSTKEFQTMLEGLNEEDCVEESSHVSEKKRRLSVDQVRALEKNFELENKLEPERKVSLAQELGLQPRQVAVWFQNRRARWKTKQLERDYALLKANYDGLKLNFESLQHENEALLKEIEELKSKLNADGSRESKLSAKEEGKMSETEEEGNLETLVNSFARCEEGASELNFESFNGAILGVASIFGDIKDGSSDSDSSAILNEDNNNSPSGGVSSCDGILHHSQHQFLGCSQNGYATSINTSSHILDSNASASTLGDGHQAYQLPFVKNEEDNFFDEESCSSLIFCDDQAPSLHWYCSDEWQ